MLSNSSKYAIRGVIHIALYANKEKKIGSVEVAEKLSIPAPFLAKILQDLKRKNIISSTKGPKGGFYLTEENLQNSVLDIVECVDGLDKYSQCIMGLHQCNSLTPCALHTVYEPFKIQFLSKLANHTIKDFADDIRNGNSFIVID